MDFQESLKYLYSLGNEVLAMKLGLETTETLLAALGNPQKKFLKVQIAGTNGKGSTCALLEAICLSAKIKVGLTTSPHLISITERIKINGEQISEESFAEHATKIRSISENLVTTGRLEAVPTYFEQVTAIAISVFGEAEVELAILETGLGGRFDSITAARAEIVALTPIDYDHQQILGDTLEKIALEKAAIIRADTRAVIAVQKDEAEKVIAEVSRGLRVRPERTANIKTEIKAIDENKRFVIDFNSPQAKYENVHLSLLGRHQIENAKVAVLLAENLQEHFRLTPENIVKGLETATHSGRLEFYSGVLFDGAHNIAGAKALREFLDEFVSEPLTMIFGAMRDKNIEEISGILLPGIDNLILTEIDNPRSITEADWQQLNLPKTFDGRVYYAAGVSEALEKAGEVSKNKSLILITGSLYLIGEAKKILNLKS